MSPPCDLVLKMLYGCGLRLSGCLNLRINNFNFDAGILTVHDGKGKKDRTVPIPEVLVDELKVQIFFDRIEEKYKMPLKNLSGNGFFQQKY